jgi:hypothetical protein
MGLGKGERERGYDKEAAEPLPASPAFPRPGALLRFQAPPGSSTQFFIDRTTLAVTPQGEVRYVIVARSSEGVDNVRFEALRCGSAEFRTYSFGRADGTWGGKASEWRPIARSPQPWQAMLYREYFCPQANPIASPAEGVRALEQGGHPFAKGFSGDALRGR